MQEQLAEKQERDAREEAQREQKGDLRIAIRPRIEAWQAGKKWALAIACLDGLLRLSGLRCHILDPAMAVSLYG